MTEKYTNKFHNFKFETNAEKDLQKNVPILNQTLSSENITDDCSNEILLEYKYAANVQENLDKSNKNK